MKNLIRKCLAKVFRPLLEAVNDSHVSEIQKLRSEMLRIARDTELKVACIAVKSLVGKKATNVRSIQETEFRVFSQLGKMVLFNS